MSEHDTYGSTQRLENISLSRNIQVENLTDKAIRAILYSADDKLQWIPLGGVAGPGVALIQPGEVGKLELPVNSAVLKIFRPLLVDCPIDALLVCPGQTIQFTGASNMRRATTATATVGAGMLGMAVGTILLGPLIGVVAAAGAAYATTREDDVGEVITAVGTQVAQSAMVAKESIVDASQTESAQRVSTTVREYASSVARQVTTREDSK